MSINYTKQAKDYLDIYWKTNKEYIEDRLIFLLKEFESTPDYAGPADIWYYFEEARHTFMMGDFVSSIILSACTIELWMAHLLKIPYYQPRGSVWESDEGTYTKLLDSCLSRNIIAKDEYKHLRKLNELRTFYVHGKDISESLGNKRESRKKSKFWGSPMLIDYYGVKPIERDARYPIRILFQFYKNHHYSQEL